MDAYVHLRVRGTWGIRKQLDVKKNKKYLQCKEQKKVPLAVQAQLLTCVLCLLFGPVANVRVIIEVLKHRWHSRHNACTLMRLYACLCVCLYVGQIQMWDVDVHVFQHVRTQHFKKKKKVTYLGLLQTWGTFCFGAGGLLVFTLLLTEGGARQQTTGANRTMTEPSYWGLFWNHSPCKCQDVFFFETRPNKLPWIYSINVINCQAYNYNQESP